VTILAGLQRRFGDAIVETHEHRGDLTVVVARDALLAVLAHCRDDAALAFDVLMDLTAVDYVKFPGRETARASRSSTISFSIAHTHRLRLKVRVDEDDAYVPSAVALWPIANWLEREVWDMFGVAASRGTRIRVGSHVRGVRGPSAAEGLSDQPSPAADRAGELGGAMAATTRREFMLGEGSGTGSGPQNVHIGIGPRSSRHARDHPDRDRARRRRSFVAADVEIGYLHRASRRDCEQGG